MAEAETSVPDALFVVVFVNQPVDDIDDGDAVDIRIAKIILCNQQFLIIISNVKEIVGFTGCVFRNLISYLNVCDLTVSSSVLDVQSWGASCELKYTLDYRRILQCANKNSNPENPPPKMFTFSV